ncbi:hypothetical protein Tco_0018764 [Tanacetum coccineum]
MLNGSSHFEQSRLELSVIYLLIVWKANAVIGKDEWSNLLKEMGPLVGIFLRNPEMNRRKNRMTEKILIPLTDDRRDNVHRIHRSRAIQRVSLEVRATSLDYCSSLSRLEGYGREIVGSVFGTNNNRSNHWAQDMDYETEFEQTGGAGAGAEAEAWFLLVYSNGLDYILVVQQHQMKHLGGKSSYLPWQQTAISSCIDEPWTCLDDF